MPGTTTEPLHASRLSIDTDTDPAPIVTAAKQTITDGNFSARLTDSLACGGTIVTGAPGCIIEGQLAARVGDSISHGSVVMTGSPIVIIGNVGGGGGGGDESEKKLEHNQNDEGEEEGYQDRKSSGSTTQKTTTNGLPQSEKIRAASRQAFNNPVWYSNPNGLEAEKQQNSSPQKVQIQTLPPQKVATRVYQTLFNDVGNLAAQAVIGKATGAPFEAGGPTSIFPEEVPSSINSQSTIISTAPEGTPDSLLPESSLTGKQAAIHAALPKSGDTAVFPKRSISFADLRAIGRVTGDEYSAFTLGSRRLVIRSFGREVIVSSELAADLRAGRYGRWSGHTHPPGYSIEPGPEDRPFLIKMGQERSSIWGDKGYKPFGQTAVDDARIQTDIARRKWEKLYGASNK